MEPNGREYGEFIKGETGMKEKDRELMERYIYEVISHLPRQQREEIAMELRGLIEDMAEGTKMEAVLEKLGAPVQFAEQYRDKSKYVISPAYYDNYEWVLKIVMACVLVSSVVSAIIQRIMGNIRLWEVFSDMIGNTLTSGIFAFGFITLLFAILERQKVKLDWKQEKEWSVNDLEVGKAPAWTSERLKPIPNKKSLISRGESVASIIFIVLFCGLILFAPHLFGAYVFDDGVFVRTIPLLNLEQWNMILPVFLIGMLVGFMDEVIRLVTGCYCRIVLVSSVISGVINIVTGVIILKLFPFWNPDFLTEVSQEFDFIPTSTGDLLYYYGTDFFSNVVLIIICFAAVLGMSVTIYRTVRYGTD